MWKMVWLFCDSITYAHAQTHNSGGGGGEEVKPEREKIAATTEFLSHLIFRVIFSVVRTFLCGHFEISAPSDSLTDICHCWSSQRDFHRLLFFVLFFIAWCCSLCGVQASFCFFTHFHSYRDCYELWYSFWFFGNEKKKLRTACIGGDFRNRMHSNKWILP